MPSSQSLLGDYSTWNWDWQCCSWEGLSVSPPGCQMSVSSLRWPRTYTTCWSTKGTSWTVEVLSRWRGRGKWPLTSSPAVPRAVNNGEAARSVTPTALIWQRLQRDWVVSSAMSTEARCEHTLGTGGGQRRRARPVCMLSRTRMHTRRTLFMSEGFFPKLLERSRSPVALERKWLCLCLWAIVQVFHLESLFIFLRMDFCDDLVQKRKIYIDTKKNKTMLLKRKYARTTWRMKMTKEQMFDMKHTLMNLFRSTVTLSNLLIFWQQRPR